MTLDEVFKDIEKISGKGSIMVGVEIKDVERIGLPATGLNRILYGGIPKGRLIEFSGAEASGKTTTSFLVAGAYQKQDDRPVFFVDAEGTYDPRWAAKVGVDNSPGKFIKWAPENVTAEEVFEKILRVAETNEVGLIILDSIPALVPQQEDSKNMSEYQMGGISKPLTVFARKLQKVLLKNPTVTFIGINQVRDNMSSYGQPTTTVGGHGWKHMCSVRVEFRSENIDKNGGYLSDSADNPAGVRINAALKKNKTAPRNRKLAYYILDFETGFNEVADIVASAIVAGVIKQAGASFSYVNKETGEVMVNALGRAKFQEKLTPEVLEMIKEELKNYD